VFRKLLVPLDGSKLTEIVLPYMEKLAIGCNIPQIILLSVTEPVSVNFPVDEVSDHVPIKEYQSSNVVLDAFGYRIQKEPLTPLSKAPAVVGKTAQAAEAYLTAIATNLTARGFNVATEVLIGNPVKEIVHFANEENIDLIVMASWGKHGMSKWSITNVAEKVFRQTNIPMFLIKPPPDFK